MKDCPLLMSWLACCKVNKHFSLHVFPGIDRTVDIQLPICTPCMHVDFRKVYMYATVCACIHKSCALLTSACYKMSKRTSTKIQTRMQQSLHACKLMKATILLYVYLHAYSRMRI